MNNRQYRLIFGVLLLVALYFDQLTIIYILMGLAIFEAISNLRVPTLVTRLLGRPENNPQEGALGIQFKERFMFEAERSWRITVVSMLALSLFTFPDALWFFPWFIALALIGAGISGVCPMYLFIKWLGFK